MVRNQVISSFVTFGNRNEGTFRVLIKWARGLGLEGGVIEGRVWAEGEGERGLDCLNCPIFAMP
jgi:hypothetical protein